MFRFIKKWCRKRRRVINQQRLHQELRDIKYVYNVTERNGCLYLMVENRAVAVFTSDMTVGEVLLTLQESRQAQMSYKEILKIKQNETISSTV